MVGINVETVEGAEFHNQSKRKHQNTNRNRVVVTKKTQVIGEFLETCTVV